MLHLPIHNIDFVYNYEIIFEDFFIVGYVNQLFKKKTRNKQKFHHVQVPESCHT